MDGADTGRGAGGCGAPGPRSVPQQNPHRVLLPAGPRKHKVWGRAIGPGCSHACGHAGLRRCGHSPVHRAIHTEECVMETSHTGCKGVCLEK